MPKTTMAVFWTRLLNEHSPRAIEFWGTILVQLVFFWLPSLFYLALDHSAPRFSQSHKLQPETKQPTAVEVKECLKVVARNQCLSALIHITLMSPIGRPAGGSTTTYRQGAELPSPNQIVRDVVLCIFLREILFYYSHRLLHLPSIYPRIHKVHHRFKAPVALAAQYAHPVEHLLANTLPISIPPMILNCHVVSFWAFLAVELLETTTAHSGYDFLARVAKTHDAHHEKFVINYGTIGLLDWVHGTGEKDAVTGTGTAARERKIR